MNKQVVVQLKGGLGNQLFQYALGRHLAMRLEADLLFDSSVLENRVPVADFTFRSFDLAYFPIAGRIASATDLPLFDSSASIRSPWSHIVQITRLLMRGYSYVYERKFAYNPSVLQKQANRIYLNGYWQSYRYFETIAPTLRTELTFRLPLPESASIVAQQISNSESVCLHIRRSDFLHIPLHQVASEEYIDRAVRVIAQRIDHPIFFVFSDDLAWCQANLSLPYPVVFVPDELAGHHGTLHFRLMAHCKHFITANSTFSWWAAWLSQQSSDKLVITPDQWFSDGRSIDDLIPDSWIRL
ncbi:alpha-1,2-fucosyltransferase [Spirosoma koreense]